MNRNKSKLQNFEIEKIIEEHAKESTEYTRILSSIFRQLAFSEGSLFWFLKTQFAVSIPLISFGLIFLVFFFICDALQYFNGYLKFTREAKRFEKNLLEGKTSERNYQDSVGLHLAITIPFKCKLLFLIIATLMLLMGFIEGAFGYKISW